MVADLLREHAWAQRMIIQTISNGHSNNLSFILHFLDNNIYFLVLLSSISDAKDKYHFSVPTFSSQILQIIESSSLCDLKLLWMSDLSQVLSKMVTFFGILVFFFLVGGVFWNYSGFARCAQCEVEFVCSSSDNSGANLVVLRRERTTSQQMPSMSNFGKADAFLMIF